MGASQAPYAGPIPVAGSKTPNGKGAIPGRMFFKYQGLFGAPTFTTT